MRGAQRGVGVIRIDRPGAIIGRGRLRADRPDWACMSARLLRVSTSPGRRCAGLLQPGQRLPITAEFVEDDANIVAGGWHCRDRVSCARRLSARLRFPLPEAAKTYGAKLQRARHGSVVVASHRSRSVSASCSPIQLDQQFGELKVRNIAAGAADQPSGDRRPQALPAIRRSFASERSIVEERGVEAGPAFDRPIEPWQTPPRSRCSLLQRGADIVAGVGIGRIERLRPLALGDRLLKSAQADTGTPIAYTGSAAWFGLTRSQTPKQASACSNCPDLIVKISGPARRVPVVRIEVEHADRRARRPALQSKSDWQGFSSRIRLSWTAFSKTCNASSRRFMRCSIAHSEVRYC